MDTTQIIIMEQEVRQRLHNALQQLNLDYPPSEKGESIKPIIMTVKRELRSAIDAIERPEETDRRINKRYTYHPNPFFDYETNRYRSNQEGNSTGSESFDG